MNKGTCRFSVGAGVPDQAAAVRFLFWKRQANSESCTREVQEAFPYGKNIRFPRKRTWTFLIYFINHCKNIESSPQGIPSLSTVNCQFIYILLPGGRHS